MKAVVFAGSRLGAAAVGRLVEAGFEIPLVITGTDLPAPDDECTPVEEACRQMGITCVRTMDPNRFGWLERIKRLGADMIFSMGYRGPIKARLLATARHGAFRMHYSLLPMYRGPDPVRRAIMAGERTTGVTLHVLEPQAYSGALIDAEEVDIEPEFTAPDLERRLDEAAEAVLARVLPRLGSLDYTTTPQDLTLASVHKPVSPEEGRINWGRPAGEIHDLVRAFARPFTGAFGLLGDDLVFFWRAGLVRDAAIHPGTCVIVRDTALVGAIKGCIEPVEIEVNGRVLTGEGLLAYFREHEGEEFQ
jgi:UDP-4-amino-4-deoxy-L-arabinose formyltransferase/UDP-glucuronic acid dehydrogenase (UDP-4-keto-hexauronic acid decarboxylating)